MSTKMNWRASTHELIHQIHQPRAMPGIGLRKLLRQAARDGLEIRLRLRDRNPGLEPPDHLEIMIRAVCLLGKRANPAAPRPRRPRDRQSPWASRR